MAEVSFTSITVEAKLSGTWTDITADVRHNPSPKITGIGIMGNDITDRVGDVGTITFNMDNSTSNSGGLNGYYTPNHANVRSGWQPGIAVRVKFVYDGTIKYLYGVIDYDGITPTPGSTGRRDVEVRASNWMKSVAEHKLNLLQRKTNYRIDQAVQDIIDNMDRKPQKISWRGQGLVTFPTVFDMTQSDTAAVSEFEKLAKSEFGRVYCIGDGTDGETLAVENQTYRGLFTDSSETQGAIIPIPSIEITDDFLLEDGSSFLLLENGDNLLLENNQRASFAETDLKSMQVSFGKNLHNKITFKIYPRTVDASPVVLASLDEPIEIAAAETLTEIRHSFNDPDNPDVNITGFDMVLPVATTDYQMFQNSDGTGTDRTADLSVSVIYGSSEAEYSLTNNNAAVSYVTKLDARGYGVYVYDTEDKLYKDTTSIAANGVRSLDIDMPYISDFESLWLFAEKSDDIFDGLLANIANPNMSVDSVTFDVNKSTKLMSAFMFLEPGTYIKLTESMTANAGGGSYSTAFFINGYDVEIVSMRLVRWTCILRKDTS